MRNHTPALHRALAALAAPLTLGAAACGDGERAAPPAELPRAERSFVVERWDTAWALGAGAQDTTLLLPRLLAASPSGVYVYDDATFRLRAFDGRGSLRWAFGREGSGPDELRNVRDLKLAADGSVLLLDPRNNRIVRLSPEGRVLSRIPLTGVGNAEQMVPLADGSIALFTLDPKNAFTRIDAAGRTLSRFTLPSPEYPALHMLASQGLIAADPRAGTWVFGFSMGDGWFAYRDTDAVRSGRYVEHVPFPRVVERKFAGGVSTEMAEYAPCSACTLAMSDSILYVHFGGNGDERKAALDRFSLATGRYLGSYRLPGEATAVTVGDGMVYALVEEPFPQLLALRPRPRS